MAKSLTRIPGWIYPLLVLAILLVWELWPPENRPINPEVYPAMESIVSFCTAEPVHENSVRCQDVRYLVRYCRTRGRNTCSVAGFYDLIAGMGFKLPPLNPLR